MSSFKEIDLNPSRGALFGFRGVVLGGCSVFGGIQYLLHRPSAALVILAIGVGIAVLSMIPPLGRLLYIAWMGLGIAIGLVTTPIILAILYLGLLTPVGFLLRLAGRDPLKRRARGEVKSSYWERAAGAKSVKSYFRQY